MIYNLEAKTLNALKWIVEILDRNNIPYRIGGGFAAHIYGSKRPTNDIDVSLSGKYFPVLLPELAGYITHECKHYSNTKWDCDGLTLNYEGQDIDITDVDTLRMSNKEKTDWYQTKDNFRKFDPIPTEIEGITVSLMDPRDLVAYKEHLDGDHQVVDVEAVKEYIANNNNFK